MYNRIVYLFVVHASVHAQLKSEASSHAVVIVHQVLPAAPHEYRVVTVIHRHTVVSGVIILLGCNNAHECGPGAALHHMTAVRQYMAAPLCFGGGSAMPDGSMHTPPLPSHGPERPPATPP